MQSNKIENRNLARDVADHSARHEKRTWTKGLLPAHANLAISLEEFFLWWDINCDAVIERASQKSGWRHLILSASLGARSFVTRLRRVGDVVEKRLQDHLQVLELPGLAYGSFDSGSDSGSGAVSDLDRDGDEEENKEGEDAVDRGTCNVSIAIGSTAQTNLLEPKEERMSVTMSIQTLPEEEAENALQDRGGGGQSLCLSQTRVSTSKHACPDSLPIYLSNLSRLLSPSPAFSSFHPQQKPTGCPTSATFARLI